MIFLILRILRELPNFIFWASAFFGTTLFLLRLCMGMVAGLVDGLIDGDDVHYQTGSLKLFTLHSISGFFMMFGWVGLACAKQLSYDHQASILYGLLAGVITMVLTALIFKWSQLLVSSGTRFKIENTVGLVGSVYQRISDDAPGKILVSVDGITRELLALSCDGSTIESFETVKVVAVVDYEMVIVQQLSL